MFHKFVPYVIVVREQNLPDLVPRDGGLNVFHWRNIDGTREVDTIGRGLLRVWVWRLRRPKIPAPGSRPARLPQGCLAPLRCLSQPTLWGHASRVPGRGWQGVAPPPFDPPGRPRSGGVRGRGLAPRPSCRCVLSRAPHEGHMAAGSCWGRLRGRGLGEATRGLVGQINGELAEDTRAKSALRTALQAHRGKPGNVDPKALAA